MENCNINEKTILYLNRAFAYNLNATTDGLGFVYTLQTIIYRLNYSNTKKAIDDVKKAIELSDQAHDSIKAHLYGLAYKYAKKANQEASKLVKDAKSQQSMAETPKTEYETEGKTLNAKFEAEMLEKDVFFLGHYF